MTLQKYLKKHIFKHLNISFSGRVFSMDLAWIQYVFD